MPLIDEGCKAPAFSLPDQDGTRHALDDYAGRHVVLYFYPKDDTSGCTLEACRFRDTGPAFDATRAVILGVSPDSEASHQRFAQRHDIDFTLLADLPGSDGVPKTCEKYGVWQEKSMYGRRFMGVVRTTYLIGPDGTVLRRWDGVKVPGHAEAVLEAIVESS